MRSAENWGTQMRDEETDGGDGAVGEEAEVVHATSPGQDLFGDFSVVGPGVHIVLEGRPVSIPAR